MDVSLAKAILATFDTPVHVETIQSYANAEISRAYLRLRAIDDPIQIYRLQGQIQAMESLKKIRDTAVQVRDGR